MNMSQNLISVIAFWSLGSIYTIVEAIFPRRAINYRRVLLYDIGALVLYVVFFKVAVAATDRIPVPDYVPAGVLELPLPLKVFLFYLLEDFGLYWVHRLMHTKYVWRVHKWHHSPTYMYWLAGVRATVPHIVLFNLCFSTALPILHSAPTWVFQLLLVEHMFRNDFMHMNVTWKSDWLEWVFVTPRYHHFHHSEDPSHFTANLGSLLTIWDRLFRTYGNPESLKKEIAFGIGEDVHPVRLAIGF